MLVVTFWDHAFIALRPLSLPGGKLAILFKSMARWAAVDYLYGEQAWLDKNPLPGAKSQVGFIIQNFYMFYVLHIFDRGKMSWTLKSSGIRGTSASIAPLNGLVAAVVQLTRSMFYGMFALVLFITRNLLSKALVVAELGSEAFHEQTSSVTMYLVVQ